jgi:hypothetical protein
VLGLPPAAAASSVWISNCQRSSVSFVSIDLIARTRRFIEAVRSHSDHQLARKGGGFKEEERGGSRRTLYLS